MATSPDPTSNHSAASNAVDPPASSMATQLCRIVLLVVLATAAAFGGALSCGFVDWDDTHLLIANRAYRGLGPANLRWMFTTTLGGHYQPLTWLSYAIDYRLWGLDALGFHLTNLLLHSATAIGFLFIARRLLCVPHVAADRTPRSHGAYRGGANRAAVEVPRGQPPAVGDRNGRSRLTYSGLTVGSLAAALAFAVHPLRVESVVWVTERRDVLSGAWLMLTLLCYLRAIDPGDDRRRYRWFVAAVICYVLSLLSKATGMTLPVVLLLLDLYPLRRIGSGRRSGAPPAHRVLAEKLAFAIPAAAVAVVALSAQARGGALWPTDQHPMGLRVGQAFYGLVFYPLKTLWPAGLVPLYEQRPDAAALDAVNVASALAVVATTIGLYLLRRRAPALLAAWIAYGVIVAPMLGIAQSGPQVVADRYSYVSCMPFALLFGAGVRGLWVTVGRGASARRIALAMAMTGVAIAMILATRAQTRVWRDSYALWSTTVARAPDTPTAHANLAAVQLGRGDYVEARAHAATALRTLPGNLTAHTTMGRAALATGDLDEAETHFREAVRIAAHIRRPSAATTLGLADTLARAGRLDEAIEAYRAVIALAPRSAPAHLRLGVVLTRRGLWGAAVTAWTEGVERAPDDANLLSQLAWALATCPDAAVRDGARAERLARRALHVTAGRHARSREALAAALAEQGDFAAAVATLRDVLDDASVALPDRARARIESALRSYERSEPFRDAGD